MNGNGSYLAVRAIAALTFFCLFSSSSFADDDSQLNDIYRQFFISPVDLSTIESLYRSDIIHVGRADAGLVRGKEDFMQMNIRPLAEMVNSGQISISGRAYVVRRIVVGDMANDVGYLHMTITMPDGQSQEELQKFSWVFLKSEGRWRVVTDFDATPAPISVLDGLETQFIVESSRAQP